MGRFIDMTGLRFSRWTVISLSEHRKESECCWICKCDCGTVKTIRGAQLRLGKSKSCGCLQREKLSEAATTHGKSRTKVYISWCGMLNRCYRVKNNGYKNYGGRGITVCDRWRNFENFYNDMGDPPSNKHSLDRKDNNGNYEPGNCRWATRKEQNNNQRKRPITYIDFTCDNCGKCFKRKKSPRYWSKTFCSRKCSLPYCGELARQTLANKRQEYKSKLTKILNRDFTSTLTCRRGESIVTEDFVITILQTDEGKCTLGICHPKTVSLTKEKVM